MTVPAVVLDSLADRIAALYERDWSTLSFGQHNRVDRALECAINHVAFHNVAACNKRIAEAEAILRRA